MGNTVSDKPSPDATPDEIKSALAKALYFALRDMFSAGAPYETADSDMHWAMMRAADAIQMMENYWPDTKREG